MPRYGYDGDLSETGFLCQSGLEGADLRAGRHYRQQEVGADSEFCKKRLVELPRLLVHHSGGGGVGVFAYFIARQHIGEQVGHIEYALRPFQCLVAAGCLGIKLEYGIEIHYLDAGCAVELFARNYAENLIRDAGGVGVSVGARQSCKGAVLSDAAEIHAPGVDAD